MTPVQAITSRTGNGSDQTVRGSFRIERGVMTVRHHSSGCSRSVQLGWASDAETLARLILLEIDDEHRSDGD